MRVDDPRRVKDNEIMSRHIPERRTKTRQSGAGRKQEAGSSRLQIRDRRQTGEDGRSGATSFSFYLPNEYVTLGARQLCIHTMSSSSHARLSPYNRDIIMKMAFFPLLLSTVGSPKPLFSIVNYSRSHFMQHPFKSARVCCVCEAVLTPVG